MPRYYFHIIDLDRVAPDEEGLELKDDDTAIKEARRAAVDMLRDAVVANNDILHQVIEIREGSRVVANVSLASIAILSGGRQDGR